MSLFCNLTNSPVANAASNDHLLSENRPAYASSVRGNNGAEQAVDGDSGTRWESQWGVDPQWIYVDLGASASISRIVINWETAYATSFRIEVSDDEYTWNPIHTKTGFTVGIYDVNVSGVGRFVRLYCMQRARSAFGDSLYEFQVYGSGGVNPPPAQQAANIDLV